MAGHGGAHQRGERAAGGGPWGGATGAGDCSREKEELEEIEEKEKRGREK
jgi:hypothetical protein